MKTYLLCISIFLSSMCYAQVTFETHHGGEQNDWNCSVRATEDGGYIATGFTRSFGAGEDDAILNKIDARGNLIWQKTFGGILNDYTVSLELCPDGGYIICGATMSFSEGECDIFLVKTDPSGNEIWSRTYGDEHDQDGARIITVSDGGYLVLAYSNYEEDGPHDISLLRIDESGNLIWQSNYGSGSDEKAYGIAETRDGGFIVTGSLLPAEGGDPDIYVFKVNESGNLLWEKTILTEHGESGKYIIENMEGEYVLCAGSTDWVGYNEGEIHIIKLDPEGELLSQWIYKGSEKMSAYSILETAEGYTFCGIDRNHEDGRTDDDALLMKIDHSGNVIWKSCFGGTGVDKGLAVIQTEDNGYLLTGFSSSFSHADEGDIYFIKTNSVGKLHGGSIGENDPFPFSVNPSISIPGATVYVDNASDQVIYSVEMYSLQGSLIQSYTLNAMSGRLVLPVDLETGHYILRINPEGEKQESEGLHLLVVD